MFSYLEYVGQNFSISIYLRMRKWHSICYSHSFHCCLKFRWTKSSLSNQDGLEDDRRDQQSQRIWEALTGQSLTLWRSCWILWQAMQDIISKVRRKFSICGRTWVVTYLGRKYVKYNPEGDAECWEAVSSLEAQLSFTAYTHLQTL
jgi:hypothetical protein